MSKALVIGGADFSANKLDTVSLLTPVPCTGIALNVSAVSFTKFHEVATLTANVTPADTTDTVIWASSDTDVVEVVGGVLTAVGVGSATITATCGNHSATCTVTAKVVYNESGLSRFNGYGIILNPWNSDRMAATSSGLYMAFAMPTNVLNGYQAAYNSESVLGSTVYPIPLPKKASSMKITLPSSTALNNAYIYYTDSQTNQTYSTGVYAAKGISSTDPSISSGTAQLTVDLTGVTDADSVVINFRCSSGNTPSACTTPVVITIE